MIYNGLEFGAYFEIPYNSPCYSVLLGKACIHLFLPSLKQKAFGVYGAISYCAEISPSCYDLNLY